jgi:CRP/FNR family cyclic AMP-dependent transcriptional regulator
MFPTPHPYLQSPRPPSTQEQNPAAALFVHIDRRFGRSCRKITARRNSLLCCQGEKLTSLFLVREGEILLTRVSADGRDTLISVLGPGDFFGEGALLSDAEVTFSASATKRSVLSLLPERLFRELLDDQFICRCLLGTIARRCADAWTQMEVIGCSNVRDKVRTGLHWLSCRDGVATEDGIRIDLNQTRLARMVGCARETLSREVSELKRNQLVEVRSTNGRKFLYLVDPDSLFQST